MLKQKEDFELRIAKLGTRPKGGSPKDNFKKSRKQRFSCGSGFQPRSRDWNGFYDLPFIVYCSLFTVDRLLLTAYERIG
jgi:hypothetical protein